MIRFYRVNVDNSVGQEEIGTTGFGVRADGQRGYVMEQKVLSVPEAGKRYFGMSRAASYRAANSGGLPVVKINGRMFVPVAALERMLETALTPADSEKRQAGEASCANIG